MTTAPRSLTLLVRLFGGGAVLLGLLFWAGSVPGLIGLHMGLGWGLVLSLWALAATAARGGARPGLVALAVLWGVILPIFGMTQARLLPGSNHWIIRLLHLAVGAVAIGLAGRLAAAAGHLTTVVPSRP